MTQLGKFIERLPLPQAPPSLEIGREIHRGAYGAVYEGQLSGQPIAVKKVHELLVEGVQDGEEVLRKFLEEYKRLRLLDHPNVIKVRGAFKDAKLGVVLVMERMKENLRRFLEQHRGNLSIQEQLHIALEITQGIVFLHQLNPPLVRRDLNDKNVMISKDGVAKLGDFGQSKMKEDLYLTTTAPGMLAFMPPECLRSESAKYNESIDVFSLGVLLLEIGTQQVPTPNMEGIGTTREVKRREKDLQKMNDSHPFKPFILLCLSDDQKQRPKSTEMLTVLSRLDVTVLQTVLAADQRIRMLEADLQLVKERLTATKDEKRSLQAELGCAKNDVQAARECFEATVKAREGMQEELDCAKDDVQEAEEKLAALELAKQKLQEELFRAKMKHATDDNIIRHLHSKFVKVDAALKEKDEQLSRTHEEAKNFQAMYHEAESKRWAATSQFHELELAMDGKKPKKKAEKFGSEEKQRIMDRLIQKDNEIWEKIREWNVQKLQQQNQAIEKENMELRRKLVEAEQMTSYVLHDKEMATSAADRPSDAAEPVPQLGSVATAKLSTISTPDKPVPGSLTEPQYEEMDQDKESEPLTDMPSKTQHHELPPVDKDSDYIYVSDTYPWKFAQAFTFNESKSDLDRETERHSEEASSRPTRQHSLQKVDKDSDKHDYVNDEVIAQREEQKLKEEHNSTGIAESIKHPPTVDPCQPPA